MKKDNTRQVKPSTAEETNIQTVQTIILGQMYDMAKNRFCKACKDYNDCPYLQRGLQNDCPQLSDVMNGYEICQEDFKKGFSLEPQKEFDPEYLQACIKRATKSWEGIDVDKFMDEIRGRGQEKSTLREELESFLKECGVDADYVHESFLIIVANHFADWGATHKDSLHIQKTDKENSDSFAYHDDLEKEVREYIRRGGYDGLDSEEEVKQIALHFTRWQRNIDADLGSPKYERGFADGREHERRKIRTEQKETIIEALRAEYEKGRADAIEDCCRDWSRKEKSILNHILDIVKEIHSHNPAPNYTEDIAFLEKLIAGKKTELSNE